MRFLWILFVLTLMSCSNKMGYFLVVWPEEGVEIENSSILPIKSESNLRGTYILSLGNKKYAEIDKFRGFYFKKEEEAAAFREILEPFRNSYAYAKKKTPVREEASELSSRIYILRESQIIKVIGRGEEKVKIGETLEGYWYRIITDDGVTGYCFDRNLAFFEDDGSEKQGPKTEKKQYLDKFFAETWYPEAYKETAESPYPLLSRLRSGEHLKGDRDKKEVVLVTGDSEIRFRYTSVTEVNDNTFVLGGTPLELLFYPDGKLFIRYSHKGTDCSGFYVLLEKPLEEYIAAETEKKEQEYAELLGGDTAFFISENGGVLGFDSTRSFYWGEHYGLEEIIPPEYGVRGLVGNSCYVSRSLSRSRGYKGVLTLTFTDSAAELDFIYRKLKSGILELVYIPSEYIQDGVVSRIPSDARKINFRPMTEETE